MLKSVRAQSMCCNSRVFQSKLSVIRVLCLIDGPCREEEAALLVTVQPHRMDSQKHASLSCVLFSGFHVFLCNTFFTYNRTLHWCILFSYCYYKMGHSQNEILHFLI